MKEPLKSVDWILVVTLIETSSLWWFSVLCDVSSPSHWRRSWQFVQARRLTELYIFMGPYICTPAYQEGEIELWSHSKQEISLCNYFLLYFCVAVWTCVCVFMTEWTHCAWIPICIFLFPAFMWRKLNKYVQFICNSAAVRAAKVRFE